MQYQKKQTKKTTKIGIWSRRSRAYTVEQWIRNNAEDKPETQREWRGEGQSDENDKEEKGRLHLHSSFPLLPNPRTALVHLEQKQ